MPISKLIFVELKVSFYLASDSSQSPFGLVEADVTSGEESGVELFEDDDLMDEVDVQPTLPSVGIFLRPFMPSLPPCVVPARTDVAPARRRTTLHQPWMTPTEVEAVVDAELRSIPDVVVAVIADQINVRGGAVVADQMLGADLVGAMVVDATVTTNEPNVQLPFNTTGSTEDAVVTATKQRKRVIRHRPVGLVSPPSPEAHSRRQLVRVTGPDADVFPASRAACPRVVKGKEIQRFQSDPYGDLVEGPHQRPSTARDRRLGFLPQLDRRQPVDEDGWPIVPCRDPADPNYFVSANPAPTGRPGTYDSIINPQWR